MKDDSLFREEALAHYRRGEGPGDLIRLSPLWTTWTFWILLLAFVGLVAASLLVKLDEQVEGPAVVDFNRAVIVVLVPATYEGDIEVGDKVAFDSPRFGGELRVDGVGDVLDQGALPPGFRGSRIASSLAQPVISVTSRLPRGVASKLRGPGGPEQGTAVVEIEEPLLTALVPGLTELLGGADG